jgi:hypothetical protein
VTINHGESQASRVRRSDWRLSLDHGIRSSMPSSDRATMSWRLLLSLAGPSPLVKYQRPGPLAPCAGPTMANGLCCWWMGRSCSAPKRIAGSTPMSWFQPRPPSRCPSRASRPAAGRNEQAPFALDTGSWLEAARRRVLSGCWTGSRDRLRGQELEGAALEVDDRVVPMAVLAA